MSGVRDALKDAAKGATTYAAVSTFKGETMTAAGLLLDVGTGAMVGVACRATPRVAGAVYRTYANLEMDSPGYPRHLLRYLA